VPEEYIPASKKASQLLGSGVSHLRVDVKVQLVTRYHDVDLLGAGVRDRIARGVP